MLFISQDNKQYIIVGDVYDNNLSEIILSENMKKFSVIIFILIIVIMIQMEGKCHFFLKLLLSIFENYSQTCFMWHFKGMGNYDNKTGALNFYFYQILPTFIK